MKKLIALSIILFSLSFITLKAQIGLTSYSIYALGVNTNKEKKISGELKTFLNREFENTIFEIAGMYNFQPKTYHQFSVGLGLNLSPFRGIDPINSFTVPLQLEIFPLQNFKQLSVVFEVAPEFYVEDGTNIRQLWGLRYTFNKN